MKLDLHIHSTYSLDSLNAVEEVIKAAKQKGLDGIAVTDHNTFEGSRHALRQNKSDLLIIPGAEYSTDVGHLLVYFLKEGLEDIGLKKNDKGYFNSNDIIGCAHEQQALVFMAHPFHKVTDYNKKGIDLVDGIEAYNSRAAKWRNLHANLDAMEAAVRLRKPYTAGSDAHYIEEIGSAYLDLEFSGHTLEDLKLALMNNKRTIIGRATSSINRQKSQMIKYQKNKEPVPIKTLMKLGYFTYREALHRMGWGKGPIEGRFTFTEEGINRDDII